MFRMLMLLGGAGAVLARYLTGPEGERRRQVLRQRLAEMPRLAALAGKPPISPVANFFAQLGIAAIVARAGRRGGVQGMAMAMLAENLLRRLKPSGGTDAREARIARTS